VATSDLHAGLEAKQEGIAAADDHGMVADEATYVNVMNYAWLTGAWDRLAEVVDAIDTSASDRGLAAAYAQFTRDLCAWAGRPLSPAQGGDAASAGGDQLARLLLNGAEHLAIGNDVQALVAFREAVRIELSLSSLGDDLHVYWPLAIRVAHQMGDRDALEELAEITHEVDRRALRTDALAGQARVLDGLRELGSPQPDLAKAELDLREGIHVLDATGHVVWAAHAREDLGHVLARQGRHEEGRAAFEAAREAFKAMGASAWVARVEAAYAAAEV
jgi:hypothetical protein